MKAQGILAESDSRRRVALARLARRDHLRNHAELNRELEAKIAHPERFIRRQLPQA